MFYLKFIWKYYCRREEVRSAVLDAVGDDESSVTVVMRCHPLLKEGGAKWTAYVLNDMVANGLLIGRYKTLHVCGLTFTNILAWRKPDQNGKVNK